MQTQLEVDVSEIEVKTVYFEGPGEEHTDRTL
jgi:hypothetical protein